jgi:hypothetical protein
MSVEFPLKDNEQTELVPYHSLPLHVQRSLLKARLKDYCKKAYHRLHETATISREGILNPHTKHTLFSSSFIFAFLFIVFF